MACLQNPSVPFNTGQSLVSFEWDPQKAETNIKKHGVSFDEAKTVFLDPMFITVFDKDHSDNEERYITIGVSSMARLIMVAHTESNGVIRIISSRKATRKEMDFYVNAK